ncbi:MAG: YkgJ family cysteine cluster protein [Thermodesulfobacteriota bacterium]|nr:YkgJ family cysteine cluster protein [Thermodesulfobacteriota bacterium]
MTDKIHHPASAGMTCQRCGACCRKGGPAFHVADRSLIEKGKIKLADIYTIREGEPAFDNIANRAGPAIADIIKIKNQTGASSCRFYDEKSIACTIYEDRPAECRALQCWDTEEITMVYRKPHLSRKDLIGDMPELWTLVRDHHMECSYDRIGRMVEADDKEALAYVIRYDLHFRKLAVEKTGLDNRLLDFLFGQSLEKTIRRYGISPGHIINE